LSVPAFIPTPEALCSSDIKQSATLVNRLFKPFEGLTLRRFGALILLFISIQDLAHASPQSRLSSDFVAAMQFDPEFQSAIAQRDAGLEAQEQARASLLPQVSANLQRSINDTDSRSQTALGPIDRSFENYPSLSASLQIRQALFRPRAWASLAQSKAQALYAELILQGAKQDLGLRLLGVHAEWAAAQHSIHIAEEIISIQQEIAESASRQFRAGDATRVDVEVAQARIAQAQTQLAETRLSLENAKLSWAQITGRLGFSGRASQTAWESAAKGSESLSINRSPIDNSSIRWRDQTAELLAISQHSLASFQQLARDQSPVIRAQKAAVIAATEELKKVSADHLPVADLYAARSRSTSAMDNTVGTTYRSAQVGVQVSIPLYAGGAVESGIRQAQANLRRVQSDLEAAMNRLNLQIDRDWRTLEAARVDAAAQARLLQALKVLNESSTRGQSAGVATKIDMMQARLQTLTAQRDLARANARALVSWTRLMSSAGLISEEVLEELTRQIAL
jgi:outer membrane protein TolC